MICEAGIIVTKKITMSTFLHTKDSVRIKSIDDLAGYFQAHAKSRENRLIGIECEFLGVNRETGEALPYSGENGIEFVLKELAYQFGYECIEENDHIIALKKGRDLVTLEPGGQVELSAGPVQNIHQVKAQLDQFIFELKTMMLFFPKISFLAYGIQPVSAREKIEWVPKKRYEIMADYLGHRGRLAHDMMKRTATNQVNFDYTSEQDAFQKMCLSMRLTAIASALFANSSFSKGKPSGFLTERIHIWQHTDPGRSGLMIGSLCPNASFEAYLDYLLDLSMMFIVRGGKWIRITNLTFRQYISKGFGGHRATMEDFELHLSTAFPEARFKQYLEIRGADGQRVPLIPAVTAFWKGILYDEAAREHAAQLLRHFTQEDYMKLYREVPVLGLRAKIRGKLVFDLAKELVKISAHGLKNQKQFNEQEQDESIYLAPVWDEILDSGETQGERLIRLWNTTFRQGLSNVISYLSIK